MNWTCLNILRCGTSINREVQHEVETNQTINTGDLNETIPRTKLKFSTSLHHDQ